MEQFDAKISNITMSECGDKCTKSLGCNGFSYDMNKCYLSTNPILGVPDKSKYIDEYNSNYMVCNKPHPIRYNYMEKNKNALKKNTIYLCKKGENGFASYKSIIDNIIDLKYNNSPFDFNLYELKTFDYK